MNWIKKIARAILPKAIHLSILCPYLIRRRVLDRTGNKVATGPFAGMLYLDQSVGSVLEPKLLGIYEREINDFVEDLIRYQPDAIIDIGSAEGYYAVGLARRVSKCRVVAFEIDAKGRQLLEELASRNQVLEHIQIEGECTPTKLADSLRPYNHAAIVCDAEGAESHLLNPAVVPQLQTTAILVELHPNKSPGIESLLRNRFELTHKIQVAKQELRSAKDFPYLDFPFQFFPTAYLENAVSEFRQPWKNLMQWFWMVPKSRG